MEFCECGSLMIGGNCTNKKCVKHVKKFEPITDTQLETLRELYEKLDRDFPEADVKAISFEEAGKLADELAEELEEIRNQENGLEDPDYLQEGYSNIETEEE